MTDSSSSFIFLSEWYGILATVFLVKNSVVIQLTEVMRLFSELQQA